MLTCAQVMFLLSIYTYEEFLQIFELYGLPVDYILRTCLETNT